MVTSSIETEGLFLCSKEHITAPFPEPPEYNLHPQDLLKIGINIILSPVGLILPPGYPTKTHYAFIIVTMLATQISHLTH
jgi:hypothetical protein